MATLAPSGLQSLRLGLWSYISRWRPKNTAGQWIFDITLLVIFFGILAILAQLAQS